MISIKTQMEKVKTFQLWKKEMKVKLQNKKDKMEKKMKMENLKKSIRMMQ